MKSHSFQNAVKSRNEVKQDRKRSFGVKSVFDHKRFDALEISTMSCLSYNNNTTGRFSRNVTVFSFSFSLSHTHPHSLTCSLTLTHTYLRSFYLSSSFLPTCTDALSHSHAFFLSHIHPFFHTHQLRHFYNFFLVSLFFSLSLFLLAPSVSNISLVLSLLCLSRTHLHSHTFSC